MENNKERKSLAELIKKMRSPIADAKYFAVTVTADEEGSIRTSTQTCFAGMTTGSPHRELRTACEVNANKMLNLWSEIGMPGLVLNSDRDVAIFMLIGGNAIIEESIARKYIPGIFDEREFVPTGLNASAPRELVDPIDLRRAPTPKRRMEVLKRDSYRCRICGRRSEDDTDLVMNVHHFIPAERSGLSNESNLVTLCHTCHNGLDPHFDIQLSEVFPETHEAFNKEIEDA